MTAGCNWSMDYKHGVKEGIYLKRQMWFNPGYLGSV